MSRKISLSLLFFLALSIFTTTPVHKAQALSRSSFSSLLSLPFGGKVISSGTPFVSCIFVKPVPLTGLPGPFVETSNTTFNKYFFITKNTWVLGLYGPLPSSQCLTTTIPPVPIPAFPIVNFGVSLPSLF